MVQQQTTRETEIKFIKTHLGRSTWNVSRGQTGRPSADRARATGLGHVPLVGPVGTVHWGSQAKTRRCGAGEAHGVFSEGLSRGRPWGKITSAVGEGALGACICSWLCRLRSRVRVLVAGCCQLTVSAGLSGVPREQQLSLHWGIGQEGREFMMGLVPSEKGCERWPSLSDVSILFSKPGGWLLPGPRPVGSLSPSLPAPRTKK